VKTSQRCQAIRSRGERCKVDFGVDPESGLCWHHDPKRADERRRAASQGGHSTAAIQRGNRRRTALAEDVPPEPQTVEDAIKWASWAVRAVATGVIDVRTAHEVGYVLRAFLDGRKHLDSVDSRVKALRKTLKELREAS
jgi:hypothetical protein